MEPKQAWGAFSIVVLFSDAAAIALLLNFGYDPALVSAVALIVLLVYAYVLYKRYHVEVVPEGDIVQFEDPNDLRILCSIYGLDAKGSDEEVKNRLQEFARGHSDRAFVWVAPKAVQVFGTTLEIPPTTVAPRTSSARSVLTKDNESAARLARMKRCPICDSKVPRKGSICRECGADLEFYVVLGESKVGKRMLSEKAGEVRRKLRYEVPSLGDNR